VSSLMAQSRGFPVKRPAGFHWDFFLLGCTTFVAGILGLPAPNGLVPQAPVHTESLCETKMVPEDAMLSADGYFEVDEESDTATFEKTGRMKVVRTRVVEQRVSHAAMGLLTLGTMSRPLLVVLGLMPRAMFAGIFLVVGWGSVSGNGITHKTLYLLRDPRLTPPDHPLLQVKRSSILKYIGIQWLFFAMILAVSETIAGIGFPVIITVLIPLRHIYGPKWFTLEELSILDAPTANSEAVLVSLGGPLNTGKERETETEDVEAKAAGGGSEEEAALRRRTSRESQMRDTKEREVVEGGQREMQVNR
ncbi:inorganic anion exchanger, partial [Pseudohyphozyma bogoriensis]